MALHNGKKSESKSEGDRRGDGESEGGKAISRQRPRIWLIARVSPPESSFCSLKSRPLSAACSQRAGFRPLPIRPTLPPTDDERPRRLTALH